MRNFDVEIVENLYKEKLRLFLNFSQVVLLDLMIFKIFEIIFHECFLNLKRVIL